MLQFANPSFDASLFEMFAALLSGAAIVHVDDAERADPSALIPALKSRGATHALLPPSLVRAFEQAPLPLRVLVTGGESAVPEDARHYAGQLRFINAYGPTETAICSTFEIVTPDAEFSPHLGVPIGRPLPGTELLVLDRCGQPVPIGIDGEICIGGAGLGLGYWREPEQTAQAFVPHPFRPDQRLYRTGDVGRWLPDGRVVFIGRRDGQIKLRGHRIEVGEIEHALREHPGVAEAMVILRRDQPDRPVLAAYVRPQSGQLPGDDTLRQHLAQRLAESMLPDAYIAVEAWPLNAAGKINRRALPAPDHIADVDYVAPVDDVEQRIATIFAEVLELPQVGRHQRFFHIGGNSLLALRVVSRVRQDLRVELSVPQFFAHASVADLAAALQPDPVTRQRVQKIAAAQAKLAAMTPAQKQALLARKRATADRTISS